MRIEMVDPVGQFFTEIADKDLDQRSIAITYSFIIRQEPNADWPKINQAIMARWKGKTALTRVKELAWKFAEGRA